MRTLKKLANIAIAVLCVILSLTTTAFAEKPNNGVISINESTGTMPDAHRNIYSVEDGDELSMAIILSDIIRPESLEVQFGPGIEFQEVTGTSLFDKSYTDKISNYMPAMQTHDNGSIQFDLSDLTGKVNQLVINMTCNITSDIANEYDGSQITATYHSNDSNMDFEFKSAKIHALQFKIKTVDTNLPRQYHVIDFYQDQYIKNAKYELYRDADLTEPVYFQQIHMQYTACPENTPGATTVMADTLGLVSVLGLHEGTYYLVQTSSPDGYDLIETPIKLTLTTEMKEDPNDPANKEKLKEEEEEAETSLLEKIAAKIEEIDTRETHSDKVKEQMKKEEAMRIATEYHNSHPREYVPNLQLDTSARQLSVNNSEEQAELIIDYNNGLSSIDMTVTIVAIILFILLVIIVYSLTKGSDKNGKNDNQVRQP